MRPAAYVEEGKDHDVFIFRLDTSLDDFGPCFFEFAVMGIDSAAGYSGGAACIEDDKGVRFLNDDRRFVLWETGKKFVVVKHVLGLSFQRNIMLYLR